MHVDPHIVSTSGRMTVLASLKLCIAGAVVSAAVPAYAVLAADCPEFRILVNKATNDFAAIRQSVKPRQFDTFKRFELAKPAASLSECVVVEEADRERVRLYLQCKAFVGPEAKDGEKATGHMERQFLQSANRFAKGVSSCLSLSPKEGKPLEGWPKDSLSQAWTWELPPSSGSVIEVQLRTTRPKIGAEIDEYRTYKAYLEVQRYDHSTFTDEQLEDIFGK